MLCGLLTLLVILAWYTCEIYGYQCREGFLQHSIISQYHDQLNHRRPMLTDVFLSSDRKKIYGIVTFSTLKKLHGRTHKATWTNPWNVTGEKACKWFFEWSDGKRQHATLLEEDPTRENIIFYANTSNRFRNVSAETDEVQFVNVTGRATKRHTETFHKVPFCIPRKRPVQHFLAACTSTTGSMTVAKMIEWLSYHLLQGFTHFYIHFNGVSDSNEYWTQNLRRYIDAGVVTLVNRKQPRLYKDLNRFQSSIFHSCLYRTRGRVKWLGLFDTDEYWVLPQANKGQGLETRTGVGKDASVRREYLISWLQREEFKNVSAIRSRTWHFGDSNTKSVLIKEKELSERYPMQLMHHTAHAVTADYSRTKSLIRPDHVVWSTVSNITLNTQMPLAANGQQQQQMQVYVFDVPIDRLFVMHFNLHGQQNFSDVNDVAGLGDLLPILKEKISQQNTEASSASQLMHLLAFLH